MPLGDVTKGGEFVGGFDGCVKHMMSAKGLAKENAEKLCAFIGRKAGKISQAESSRLKEMLALQPVKAMQARVEKNRDGTYNVRGVPILPDHLHEGTKTKIDAEWMQKAVEVAAARRQQDGYLPSLKVGHEPSLLPPGLAETSPQPVPAGFFIPTEVKRVIFEGGPRTVLFADLLSMPPEQFARYRRGDFVGRSIEALDVRSHEITGLSLLPTAPPKYKFPNGRIAAEAVARSRKGINVSTLLVATAYFEVQDMSKKNSTAAETAEHVETASEATEVEQEAAATPEGSEAQAAEEHEGGMDDQKLDRILQMLAAISEKLGVTTAPEGETAPAEQPSPAPVEAQAAATTSGTAAYTSMQARILALESRVRQYERQKKIESTVASARKALSGISLDDEDIRALYQVVRDGGDKGAAMYVAMMRKHRAADPAETLAGAHGDGSADDAILDKLGIVDPDARLKAAAYREQWADLRAHRMCSNVTEEEFIAQQMGIEIPAGQAAQ